MTIDLKAIREREAKATKGPWYASDQAYGADRSLCPMDHDDQEGGQYTVSRSPESPGWDTDGGCPGYGICQHDADFIAHARADIPELLALVDELAAALLGIEWVGTPVPEHPERLCGYCFTVVDAGEPRAHRDGCRVDAALTRYGLLDAASRDAARERLRR